jgi:maltose alpha-D-glucosyltransferase/alpha-amylase
LRTGTPEVLAMRYDWRNNSVVFVHNFSALPREVWLKVGLEGPEGERLINLLSPDHSVSDASGTHCILLEAYGYRWYRAGSLAYLLNRSDI